MNIAASQINADNASSTINPNTFAIPVEKQSNTKKEMKIKLLANNNIGRIEMEVKGERSSRVTRNAVGGR